MADLKVNHVAVQDNTKVVPQKLANPKTKELNFFGKAVASTVGYLKAQWNEDKQGCVSDVTFWNMQGREKESLTKKLSNYSVFTK